MNLPLKIKLSSTGLGYSHCTLKFNRHVVEGYREPVMPARMVYGIAIHKFTDVMYKTSGNVKQAFDAAKKVFDIPKIDDRRSLHMSEQKHMITTCANWWTQFIEEDSTFDVIKVDDKPLTEQTFSVESFYKDDILDIDLEGTLDKIGQFKGGCYAIGDLKTTQQWDLKKYFTMYEMSRQLKMYRLACILKSRTDPDSTLGRIGKTHMGCFIDCIQIKPNANDNMMERSDVFQYSKDEMVEFENQLLLYCKQLSWKFQNNWHLVKEGLLNGTCYSKGGMCAFWNVCKSNEQIAKILLERDFIVKVWNPLDYNGLEADDVNV